MTLVDVEITIVSARDLKNVNWKHGDLCAYAAAWVDDAGAEPVKVTTRVDGGGDSSPRWDQRFNLSVAKQNLEQARLVVEIYHNRADEEGRGSPRKALVGRASMQLLEVVDAGGYDEVQEYAMKLKRPSGRPQGKVEVAVRLRERRWPAAAPPPSGGGQRDWQAAYPGYGNAYPAQPYAYPAAPQGYPYAAPYGAAAAAPQGYGSALYGAPQPYSSPYAAAPGPYGSAPGSYGAAPSDYYAQPAYQDVPQKKAGKFGGMGMGTGLAVGALAGAVGGIALDEFVDHKEDEAAEEQAEEDADRYDGRDDYDNSGDYDNY